MYILDTDHMSVLERGGHTAMPLVQRLSAISDNDVATSIVNYEEQCRGWIALTNREKDEALIRAYARLSQHLEIYSGMHVVGFDGKANAIYQDLQRMRIRVGTQDLKIASIALANNAVLLTRNLRDFARVPHLKSADWTA
jgi:tRNA(fMet)-specific endonuclease VapC